MSLGQVSLSMGLILQPTIETGSWMTSGWLMAMLFSSVFGAAYFVYGRKQQRALYLIMGILLMVVPYVVHRTGALLAVGVGLMLLPHLLVRMGLDF